jgi:predicted regulator of Ras-like GTPase activity (Roadblock/LC7/MglB family)
MNTGESAYRLRSGTSILPSQDKEFHQLLETLLQQLPAKFMMLVDVAGQVVVAKGEHANINLVMLGSLVAGDLAASQEIARLTNEYQDYQIVLREGQESHTFIAEAGNYLALFVQVGHDVPLGWARMLITKASQQPEEIMQEDEPSKEEVAEFEFEMATALEEADDDLSDLFGDALDDMWLD